MGGDGGQQLNYMQVGSSSCGEIFFHASLLPHDANKADLKRWNWKQVERWNLMLMHSDQATQVKHT